MVQKGSQNHFLLVTFPAQGHINPSLEFAKRVVATGARVTFVTTVFGQHRMLDKSKSYAEGLTFSPFSDGYDEGFKRDEDFKQEDVDHYLTEFNNRGSEALSGIVQSSATEGRPITCLIYTLLLPWASQVAHKFQLSSALLWIQAAAVFDIYYYYFCGYKDLILDNINDPLYSVKLPGLPTLRVPDLPSFFLPSNPYSFGIKLFLEQFDMLAQEPKSFPILVNTFDELEAEALKAIDHFNFIAVGPLIPSAFLTTNIHPDNSVEHLEDYIEWLNTKDESSVVYVSFGSLAVLGNEQMDELAGGLVDSGRPFLWVIRSGEHGSRQQAQDKDGHEKYSEILRKQHKGMIVPWCSQVEVLNHTSVGCFVTHCGWNSALETLAMGVPVVAFPQWTDQGTNAKLIEDVWEIGVRVKPSEEDMTVKSAEIIRCLDQVMEGKMSSEFRSKADKWKSLARNAVEEGGSSHRNLRAFVEEVGQVQ